MQHMYEGFRMPQMCRGLTTQHRYVGLNALDEPFSLYTHTNTHTHANAHAHTRPRHCSCARVASTPVVELRGGVCVEEHVVRQCASVSAHLCVCTYWVTSASISLETRS